MTLRIVRLGTPRVAGEGLRVGTVRRPPRGVPAARFASDDWYDVWYPNLAPSVETMKLGQGAQTERDWAAFRKKFRAEMARPEASRTLDLLAALQMEEMYLEDLANATEVVLDAKKKVRAPGMLPHPYHVMTRGGGSVGRAAAGALRIGNAVGAAFTQRRVLEPVEARLMAGAGGLFLILAALVAFVPRVLVYSLLALFVWLGFVPLYKSYKLGREGRRKTNALGEQAGPYPVTEKEADSKRN